MTYSTAHKSHVPEAAHSGIIIMKKIPPSSSGSSHHGSGFSPSSPGYSYGGSHDSHSHPSVPVPDFKPLGPPTSYYHHHHTSPKPTYMGVFKGLFAASSSAPSKVKPAHPSPAVIPHSSYPGPPHPHANYPGGPLEYPPMELDYDPSTSSGGHGHHSPHSSAHASLQGSSASEPHFASSSAGADSHSAISGSYKTPSSNAHLSPNLPPGTNYGYPVVNAHDTTPINAGHVNAYHNAIGDGQHQFGDNYQTNSQQTVPAQIHITPTTNFIEYTNIQSTADSLHTQQQQAHQQQAHQSPATSQQMAQEVIKYLGNLQESAAAANSANNANPHLFFGVNVPLGGDGSDIQDNSFPLYPPGANHHDSTAPQVFAPTPLPDDAGAGYPGEQQFSAHFPPTHNVQGAPQYPIDSYGNPASQFTKSLQKNQYNRNNVQFLKPPHTKLFYPHNNGASSSPSPRHKTKPSEFDIVRSVAFELGPGGPTLLHH